MVDGLVSVIMTNYNTPQDCLKAAIESVLGQTYSFFEFIIVDDASTDNSLDVIRSYDDDRIKILLNEQNIGLTKALNKALKVARGEYIARMDSDDISEPARFERQVDYLKNHPDTVVCGTWGKLFGEWKEAGYSHEFLRRKIPDRETYQIMLLFGNYPNIIHSAAMFNNRLLTKYHIEYNDRYTYAQDYRMWVECSQYAECAIIPEVLFNVRIRKGTISTGKKRIQDECALSIMQEQLAWLGIKLDKNNEKYHVGLLSKRHAYDIGYLNWIKRIVEANKVTNRYDQRKLENVLYRKWAEIVYFGIRNCGLMKKLSRLYSIPLRYFPELIRIRIERRDSKR